MIVLLLLMHGSGFKTNRRITLWTDGRGFQKFACISLYFMLWFYSILVTDVSPSVAFDELSFSGCAYTTRTRTGTLPIYSWIVMFPASKHPCAFPSLWVSGATLENANSHYLATCSPLTASPTALVYTLQQK